MMEIGLEGLFTYWLIENQPLIDQSQGRNVCEACLWKNAQHGKHIGISFHKTLWEISINHTHSSISKRVPSSILC